MVQAKEVKQVARDWLDKYRHSIKGLIGAYFSGSLSNMDNEAQFPFYSDIDIKLVVEDSQTLSELHDKVKFNGYLIDWAVRDKSKFSSPEAILGDRYISQDLFATDIIFDKDGWLSKCQQIIRNSFSEPVNIALRCNQCLENINRAFKNYDYLLIYPLAELVAVTNCRRIHIRRLLEETYCIFKEQDRIDLQELLLELLGSREMTRQDVLQDLDTFMKAFDFAVTLKNLSGFPGDFNIRTYVRPYIYHSTLDMIERGQHREAVWWLLENYNSVARALMHNDVAISNKFIQNHMDFLNRLGILTREQKAEKVQFSKSVLNKILDYIKNDLHLTLHTTGT